MDVSMVAGEQSSDLEEDDTKASKEELELKTSEVQINSDDLAMDDADESHTDDTYDYINQEIMVSCGDLGVTEPIDFKLKNERDKEMCVLVIRELLRDRQKRVNSHQESLNQISKIQRGLLDCEAKNKSLEEKYAVLEREIWDVEMKKRSFECEARKMQTKLKSQINELDKNNCRLRGRDNQYRHELRKQELHFKKLQNRLHSLMADRGRPQAAIDINRLAGSKGAKGNMSSELTQQRIISKRYEEQIHELIDENTQLRQSLLQMRSEFQDVLKSEEVLPRVEEADGETEDTSMSSEAGSEAVGGFNPAHFDCRFDMVRDTIEDGFRAELKLLKERLSGESPSERSPVPVSSGKMDQFMKKIEEQNSIISKQEDQIQETLLAEKTLKSSYECRRDAAIEEAEDRKRVFELKLSALAEDRSAVDKQTTSLEEERLKLKREREDLEVQTQVWLKKFCHEALTPSRARSSLETLPTPSISPPSKTQMDLVTPGSQPTGSSHPDTGEMMEPTQLEFQMDEE
eukprot:236965_1